MMHKKINRWIFPKKIKKSVKTLYTMPGSAIVRRTITKHPPLKDEFEMIARELRTMLYAVCEQYMTVSELRAILFYVEKQDEQITETDIVRLTSVRR